MQVEQLIKDAQALKASGMTGSYVPTQMMRNAGVDPETIKIVIETVYGVPKELTESEKQEATALRAMIHLLESEHEPR